MNLNKHHGKNDLLWISKVHLGRSHLDCVRMKTFIRFKFERLLRCYYSPSFRRVSGGDAGDVTLGDTPTDDVVVVVLPLYHMFGLFMHVIYGLTVGQQLVVMSNFDPTRYVQLVHDYKVKYSVSHFKNNNNNNNNSGHGHLSPYWQCMLPPRRVDWDREWDRRMKWQKATTKVGVSSSPRVCKITIRPVRCAPRCPWWWWCWRRMVR